MTTSFELYELVRLSFGLRNAAKSFQNLIDGVLRGFTSAYAYIDDIPIARKNTDGQKVNLHQVFLNLD